MNLSPGQILPRHFHVPFIQPARMSSTYTPHFPAGPLLTPLNDPQYMATVPDTLDIPPIPEAMQHGDNLSSIIGMAMLELTNTAPVPSPSQGELPDEQALAFYDRVNESKHRPVSSPHISAKPEPFQGQADQTSQNTVSTGTSSDKLDVIRPTGHSRNGSDPPMYSEHIDDEIVGHQLSSDTPLQEPKQLQSSSQASQNSLTSQNLESLACVRPQPHSSDSDNGPPLSDSRNLSFLSADRNIPAVSGDQHVEVATATQYTSAAHTSPLFLHPHRTGVSLPSVNYGNELDVQSTHYSASIYSSSQFQNGSKPPPRHLPKRLVMPSPLNTGPPPTAATSLHDGRVPRSQISSYVDVEQTRFQSTPLHRSGSLPVAPIQYNGNTRAKDIPIFGGRKLRKKTSIIVAPTPAPVIKAVSFAPPIIGFNEKAQSRTEDRPKRLLSKRRT